ncbi:MAG: DUF3105 domain-containing protein [Actinomycetota bacterium]|nr:DUF3105 domain-containing protein [Actinomycetota bacterium]
MRRSSGPKPLTRATREPGVSRLSRTLERIAIVIVSFAVAFVAIGLLSGYFTSHDPGGVTGSLSGPGLTYRDLGNAQIAPGAPRPTYDSNPPTSGPHVPTPVRADRSVLNANQLLTALAAGDVVLMYGGATPPPGLARLAQSTGGPFSPALAAAGDAVILARLPGINGVIALAWTRMLPITGMVRVTSGDDAVLKQFIQSWLGQGATRSGNN